MFINSMHLLEGARFVPSPNHDARPENTVPSLIVIHCISLPPGRFGGEDIEKLFTNRLDCGSRPEYADLDGLRVSAHLLIRRSGAATQFVPFNKRAWHAGESSYQGRRRCNDFSIGIELEGTDSSSYTVRQYRRLAAATRSLLARYPDLSPQRMAAHSDVAPGRKTDPGPFFERDFLARY